MAQNGMARNDRMANLNATRRTLHGVAELVLAGPEYRNSGTIRLRVLPGGFGTIRDPGLRVENDSVVCGHGSVPIHGHTCTELAVASGVEAGAPQNLYHEGSGVSPDEKLSLVPEAAREVLGGLETGDAALRRFAPDQPAVLWPEHFDVSVTLSDVTYGVSPGDSYLGEPYAYVSAGSPPADPFFNAPFGAARPLRDVGNADAVVSYFSEGLRLLSA
jgi:hypothetical protein